MAKFTGNIDRVKIRYPNLNTENLKIVGWGAGQFFNDHYPLIKDKIKIDYTVCPLEENQGKIIHGLSVKPPSTLKKEDPEKTLILILSNYTSEVMSQIMYGDYGAFPVIRAIDFSSEYTSLINELTAYSEEFQNYHFHIEKRDVNSKKFGIFYQGLAFDFTPLVLAWNRIKYPTAYHCMVTWDHQDKNLLSQCEKWLDNLILIPQPNENLGIKNMNYVLRAAKVGAEDLYKRNIDFSIRCRSDNIIISGSIYKSAEDLFFKQRNKGKIAIDIKSGHKYIPFHFSEKLMMARAEDMLKLWSIPEDTRALTSLPKHNPQDHFQKISEKAAECYIWKNYARELGYPTKDLLDSYNFAREKLTPINNHLDWYSLKSLPIFNFQIDTKHNFSSVEQWIEIIKNSDLSKEIASEISSLRMTEEDFWKKKVG